MPKKPETEVYIPAGTPFGGAGFNAEDAKKILLDNLLLEADSPENLNEKKELNFKQFLREAGELSAENLEIMTQTLYNFAFLLKENSGLSADKIDQSENKAYYKKILDYIEQHPNPLTKITISHRIRYFIIALYNGTNLAFPKPNNDLFEATAFESEITNLQENSKLGGLEWLLINMNIDSTKVSDLLDKIDKSKTTFFSSLENLISFRLLLRNNPTTAQLGELISAFCEKDLSSYNLQLTVIEKFIKEGVALPTMLDVVRRMNRIEMKVKKVDGTYPNTQASFCNILLESKSAFTDKEMGDLENALNDKCVDHLMENRGATLLFYHLIKELGYSGVNLSVFHNDGVNDEKLLLLCFITQRLGIKLTENNSTENNSTVLNSTQDLIDKIKENLSKANLEALSYFENPESNFFDIFEEYSDRCWPRFRDFSEGHFNGIHVFLKNLKDCGLPEQLIIKKMKEIIKHVSRTSIDKNTTIAVELQELVSSLELCKKIILKADGKPHDTHSPETILTNELSEKGSAFLPIVRSAINFEIFNSAIYDLLIKIKDNFSNAKEYQDAAKLMEPILSVGKNDIEFQQIIMQILSKLSGDKDQKLENVLAEVEKKLLGRTENFKKTHMAFFILQEAYAKLQKNEQTKIHFWLITPLDFLKEEIIEGLRNIHVDCKTREDLGNHPIFKLIGFLPDNISIGIPEIITETKAKILVKEMKNYYNSDVCNGSSSRADEIFGKDNALAQIETVASLLADRATKRGDGIFGKPNSQSASAKVYKHYKQDIEDILKTINNAKKHGATKSSTP